MVKKLLGIITIFVLIFASFGIAQAASTNTAAPMSVPHWTKSPINVYIPKDEKASATMSRAFSSWQSASSNRIRFNYIQDPKKADIVVKFTDKTEGLETKLGGYNVTTDGNQIKKAEITLATKSKLAKKYSNNYVYITMLHEVGHVLGMPDNSTKPTSIMYMPISEGQTIKKIDVRRLYKINGWSYADRNMPSQRNKVN